MTTQRWYSILFLCILAAAVGLFKMKYAVIDLEHQLTQTQQRIIFFQESKHLLEAEWNLLNSPDRLEKLSRQYLHLTPTKGQQIITWNQLPIPNLVPGDGPEMDDALDDIINATIPTQPQSSNLAKHGASPSKTTKMTKPLKEKSKNPPTPQAIIEALIERALQGDRH